MAYNTVNGHIYKLSVEISDVFTSVAGIDTLTFSPKAVSADATTFDNAGWTHEVVVARGLEIQVAGKAQYAAGAKDAGQTAVEALGHELGSAAQGTFRIALPDTDTAYEFTATVAEVVEFGGGVNDLAKWEATLKVDAEPTIVDVTAS